MIGSFIGSRTDVQCEQTLKVAEERQLLLIQPYEIGYGLKVKVLKVMFRILVKNDPEIATEWKGKCLVLPR